MPPVEKSPASQNRFGTEELKDLFEHAPCGYLSLEPDGRIERVNATFLAWTGLAQAAVLGSRFQDLLTIAGRIFYETHFAPMLHMQGFFDEVAFDLLASNGNPIPVLVNAVERRDSEDKVVFIRITVFNATDRRRYERELDRVNRELRAFYDTLPVGIFRADASGRIVQASRRFCTLLGIDSADDWLRAVAEADRPATERQLHRALRDGEAFVSRFRVAGGDATPSHLEMKAVQILQAGDEAPAFVGVVEDVTEQARADAQRRQLDRHSAVSQLTGGLAHNLNNILMVIMVNVESLEGELIDRPELRGIFDVSLVSTQRAAALVSRLLVYSGQSNAQPGRIEIDPYLRGLDTALAGRFGPRHELTCDLRAPGAVLEIDTGMLREAIEELVANAIAAMPAGGDVRLSSWSGGQDSSTDQGKIVIAVSDQGIGMDEATLAKAREPFFTMQEVGKGIGLGLSLVDGVCRIAGGELRLRSRPGTGTTAEMHLPVVMH